MLRAGENRQHSTGAGGAEWAMISNGFVHAPSALYKNGLYYNTQSSFMKHIHFLKLVLYLRYQIITSELGTSSPALQRR
jgi:hypothetical protein